MTLEQALLSAVLALSACVGGLFAWFKMQFNLILKKLTDCEDDREALWARIADMAAGRPLDEHGDEPTRVYPPGGDRKKQNHKHTHEKSTD